MAAGHTTAIFAAQLILLLFFGLDVRGDHEPRRQPAIFGQRLAGSHAWTFNLRLPAARDPPHEARSIAFSSLLGRKGRRIPFKGAAGFPRLS